MIEKIMKNIPIEVYKWGSIILIAFIIGLVCGFKCDKTEIQTIEKVVIKTDSVIVHDTISLTKTIIKYKEKINTVYIRDTIKEKVSNVGLTVLNDTTPCFTIEGTSPRGTYVKAELCSKEFPKNVPIDISSNMEVVEAPDTIKTITIRDSIMVKKPWYLDKKNYIIGGLIGVITGLIATR